MVIYQIQQIPHSDIFALAQFDTSVRCLVPKARAQNTLLHVMLQLEHRIQQCLVVLCKGFQRRNADAITIVVNLVQLNFHPGITIHKLQLDKRFGK